MKKVSKLEDIPTNDLTPEEFEELVKNTLFRELTPEEREQMELALPPSLRKGYRGRKKGDS